MTTDSRRWFAVQTRPHSERRAMANLIRQGFDVYFPVYRKRRSHAGKVDMIAAPLFPRYLFVAIDLTCQRWRGVQSTFGVVQLVCHGDRPAPLDDAIMEHLRMKRIAPEEAYEKCLDKKKFRGFLAHPPDDEEI